MDELEIAIENNLKSINKESKSSDLLDIIRGGRAGEGWINIEWRNSF